VVSDVFCPECGWAHRKTEECDDEQMPARFDHDPVSHPQHYTTGKIEVIDFLTKHEVDFCTGNVVKYICRCEHKGSKRQDLEKAIQYTKFIRDKVSHSRTCTIFITRGDIAEFCDDKGLSWRLWLAMNNLFKADGLYNTLYWLRKELETCE
jgi:hypothetical protein